MAWAAQSMTANSVFSLDEFLILTLRQKVGTATAAKMAHPGG